MRQRRWPGVSDGLCLRPARSTPGHMRKSSADQHGKDRKTTVGAIWTNGPGLDARTDVYGSPKQARARSVPKERLGRARACG
jgi:hypothetical protein